MGFFLTYLWIIDYFNFGKFVFNLNRSLVHGSVVHFGLNVNIFFDGRGWITVTKCRRCKNSVISTMNYIRNWAILLSPASYLSQLYTASSGLSKSVLTLLVTELGSFMI